MVIKGLKTNTLVDEHGLPTASIENLYRIFTVSEEPDSTLGLIDQEIRDNLAGFLNDRIAAKEKALGLIEKDFSDHAISEDPTFVSDYTDFVMEKLVAHSVHTAAPSFIGHMATPLPYFMLPLSRIMVALNQNLVKIETSKAFTPLERQVVGMLHHLVYQQSKAFYDDNLHNPRQSLGAFCSGGTIANLTALWVARNSAFPAKGSFSGIEKDGFHGALDAHGYKGAAVLVSRRGHYSLGKSVDLLGIGRANLIAIDTDADHRINVDKLRQKCAELKQQGIRIMSIVGVAGSTETGSVDPLDQMAEVAKDFQAHFHVDAAWGGATLLSEQYKPLLKGIELADSVTIDAHKQLYVPMGAGMVVFKNPSTLNLIEHHAEYILRKGSKDLGQYTIEGSRPGMAMLVHAAFKIIGRKGYDLLISQNIERAKLFAELIVENDDFELLTPPQTNILNYRYNPKKIKEKFAKSDSDEKIRINDLLSKVNKLIQKEQREAGKSFVSRTRYKHQKYDWQPLSSLRVVLANPMTTEKTLKDVLEEQKEIVKHKQIQQLINKI